MVGVTSYEIENDKEFGAAIEKAAKKVGDLRFAMAEIARDWFDSNKTIFDLQSSGLFPPLSPAYQAAKDKRNGRRLPILVQSGRLRDSVTKMTHEDAIVKVGKASLIIGSKVEYGIFHQSDSIGSLFGRASSGKGKAGRIIPQRKFLFIGPEAPGAAHNRVTGRLQRFLQIIENEVESKLEAL